MSLKSLIWIGVFVGSTAGSIIPELFGQGLLSPWSLIGSFVGGVAGIWAAVKINGSL